jgi:hypothetical protein
MKTLAYPKDTNSYLKTTYNMKQGEQPPIEGTRQPKSFNPSFCSIQPSNSPPSLSSFIKQSVVSSLMKQVHGSLQNVGGLGP